MYYCTSSIVHVVLDIEYVRQNKNPAPDGAGAFASVHFHHLLVGAMQAGPALIIVERTTIIPSCPS